MAATVIACLLLPPVTEAVSPVRRWSRVATRSAEDGRVEGAGGTSAPPAGPSGVCAAPAARPGTSRDSVQAVVLPGRHRRPVTSPMTPRGRGAQARALSLRLPAALAPQPAHDAADGLLSGGVREGIGAGGEFGLELVQQVPALCRCHLERRGDVREAGDALGLDVLHMALQPGLHRAGDRGVKPPAPVNPPGQRAPTRTAPTSKPGPRWNPPGAHRSCLPSSPAGRPCQAGPGRRARRFSWCYHHSRVDAHATHSPWGRAQPVRSAWSPSTHRPAAALAGWRRTWEASMWVSWVVVRRVVVGLVLVALAFLGLEVSLFLLTALFLD